MNTNFGDKFKSILGGYRDLFAKSGLSEDQVSYVTNELEKRYKNEPDPKIALIGFAGVGKSSTLNALFNAGQEISHVKACTKEEKEIVGDYSEYTGSKGTVRVWDMPGIGEDIEADKKHLETYKKVIPNVDVVVWTIQADYRAMTPMQQTILLLKESIGEEFVDKLMFAINKADTIAPGETAWNTTFNIPSAEQQKNLIDFEEYVRSKIKQILKDWEGDIVSYSAKRRFNLDRLLCSMVKASGSMRQWLFNKIADVADPMELIDPQWLPYIQQMTREGKK